MEYRLIRKLISRAHELKADLYICSRMFYQLATTPSPQAYSISHINRLIIFVFSNKSFLRSYKTIRTFTKKDCLMTAIFSAKSLQSLLL